MALPDVARVADDERETPEERVAAEERVATDERVEAPEPDRDLPADFVARDMAALRDADLPRDTTLCEAAPRALKLPSR